MNKSSCEVVAGVLAACTLAFAEPLVAVGPVSAVGFGIDGTAAGVLLGAGDTRLPFVASLVGRSLFALPVATMGLVTPLGVLGLYLAMVLEGGQSAVPEGVRNGVMVRGNYRTPEAREEKYIGGGPIRTDKRSVAFASADRPPIALDGRVDGRTGSAFVGATLQ